MTGTIALLAAILLTRTGHFGTPFSLPDATLAVLFLGGLWQRRRWTFPVLLATAAIADQLAFARGTTSWCVTPAYAFLVPAYACVWLAGRASRNANWLLAHDMVRAAGNLTSSLLAAFVISSGSFFLLSGYFHEMSGVQYWSAVAPYVLPYAGWSCVYVASALVVSEFVRAGRRARPLSETRV